MSGEQQDKQRAIEAATKAGLHNDGTDDTWGGNPTAFKGQGIYVEAHIGNQLTSLRAAVPNDKLQALLHPVTKEQAHTAFWGAVMDAVRRQHPIGGLTSNELGAVANDFLQRLFPEEAHTDANPG